MQIDKKIFYDYRFFKVENYKYADNPVDLIITSYAVLLSDKINNIRKSAALLLLKILVRHEFLNEMLSDDITPYTRSDNRVTEWTKNVKKIGRCEKCGSKEYLEAHHIIKWADYPAGRLDLKNGMCLCNECHAKMHEGEREEHLIRSKRRKVLIC